MLLWVEVESCQCPNGRQVQTYITSWLALRSPESVLHAPTVVMFSIADKAKTYQQNHKYKIDVAPPSSWHSSLAVSSLRAEKTSITRRWLLQIDFVIFFLLWHCIVWFTRPTRSMAVRSIYSDFDGHISNGSSQGSMFAGNWFHTSKQCFCLQCYKGKQPVNNNNNKKKCLFIERIIPPKNDGLKSFTCFQSTLF